MQLTNKLSCCAMRDIHGITYYDSPEDALEAIVANVDFLDHMGGLFVFTDTAHRGRIRYATYMGDRLMTLIHKLKLGRVERSSRHFNDNSGNYVYVYLWSTTKGERFKAHDWYRARREGK